MDALDDFCRELARHARTLGLTPDSLPDAEPEVVREFAAVALQELAARGMVEARPAPGCWAAPRPRGH